MHHNPITALLLDDRFGDAQLIHPITQGGDVLLQGEIALFLDLRLAQRQFETQRTRFVLLQVGQVFAQDLRRLVTLRRVLEFHLYATGRHSSYRSIENFFAPQLGADFVYITLFDLLDGGVHVHLHQEMHSTAQIQTEIHRIQTQRPEKSRRR